MIRLTARQQDDAILISVSDTGPGVPQEYLPKIFDRFWRAPGTKQTGSGLGLAIAKGVVLAHGGTIWAESEFGRGSSFFSVGGFGHEQPDQACSMNTTPLILNVCTGQLQIVLRT